MAEALTPRSSRGDDILRGAISVKAASASGHQQELQSTLTTLRRILNEIDADEKVVRSGHDDSELLAFARRLINERYRRYHFFDGHLFSDPAWDIVLELFVAEVEGREVPVTNLCLTSNVPDTTILRWIKALCGEGLLVRHKDEVDKRRVLVELTRTAADSMRRYIAEQISASEKANAGADPMVASRRQS